MTAALLTPMDMSAIDAAIGERVHTLMWRGKVPQTELAAELGIDQSALSRRLRGRTSWKATELLYIAERLNVTLEDLVPGREEITALAAQMRSAAGEGPAAKFRCTAGRVRVVHAGGVHRKGPLALCVNGVTGCTDHAHITRKRTLTSAVRVSELCVDAA